MTISKHKGGVWWVECDICSDCHDLDAESFQESVVEVREAGWRTYETQENERGLGDMCPSCKEDCGI